MDGRNKKPAIIIVCSVILIVMVVVLISVNMEGHEKKDDTVLTSQKAIHMICDTTNYRETCIDSINSAGTNSSDPRELIEIVFQATMKCMNKAANKSVVLQELEKDPMAKTALEICHELAKRAMNDLERSLLKFSKFDILSVDDILLDLKTWVSGAITHQETCLDGFQNVTGESGEKMKKALKTGMEMSSNALAMVGELSLFLELMGLQSNMRRRLLSIGFSDSFPNWIDLNTRKLLTSSPHVKPNMIVAKDGSGKYTTINDALKDIPKKRNRVFVVYIKQGVYEENVTINSSLTNLLVIGDGPDMTKITGKLNYIDGVGTYHTATVAVNGDGFMARGIGFENCAGPEKHQAVALRVSADKVVFYNCRMDGYQDTLYAHTYRQFYRDCVISGTVDFIFGDGAVIMQGCTLLVRKPMENQQCIVTAQGRKDIHQSTGLVLQNCTIRADNDYLPVKNKVKSYLGRPWKEYSRTIIMESFLDGLIQPEGWLPWDGEYATKTLFYTEFNNRGPASPKMGRVKWAGIRELPADRVKRFTTAEFLDGNRWIPNTKVPFAPEFIFPVPKQDPNVKYSPIEPEENKDLGIQANTPIDSTPKNETSKSLPPSPPPTEASSPSEVVSPEVGSPSQDKNSEEAIPRLVVDSSPDTAPTTSPDSIFEPVATTDSQPPPSSQNGFSPIMAPTAAAPSVEPPSSTPPNGSLQPHTPTATAPTNSFTDVSPSMPPSESPQSPAPTNSNAIVSPSMAPTAASVNAKSVETPSMAPSGSPQSHETIAPTPESATLENPDKVVSPALAPKGNTASAPNTESAALTKSGRDASPSMAPTVESKKDGSPSMAPVAESDKDGSPSMAPKGSPGKDTTVAPTNSEREVSPSRAPSENPQSNTAKESKNALDNDPKPSSKKEGALVPPLSSPSNAPS